MKVTVPKNHTHAGVFYPAGSLVDLTEADAKWLVGATKSSLEALVAKQETVVIPEPPADPAEDETEETAPKKRLW
jgi:hypothetical protein